MVKKQAIFGLAFTQLFFGITPGCNIGNESVVAGQTPSFIFAYNQGVSNPTNRAVFVSNAMLNGSSAGSLQSQRGLVDNRPFQHRLIADVDC